MTHDATRNSNVVVIDLGAAFGVILNASPQNPSRSPEPSAPSWLLLFLLHKFDDDEVHSRIIIAEEEDAHEEAREHRY